MGKGKRQRALRKNQNHQSTRHVSQKAIDLTNTLALLDNVKVNAITGEVIWPDQKEEPIPEQVPDYDFYQWPEPEDKSAEEAK